MLVVIKQQSTRSWIVCIVAEGGGICRRVLDRCPITGDELDRFLRFVVVFGDVSLASCDVTLLFFVDCFRCVEDLRFTGPSPGYPNVELK